MLTYLRKMRNKNGFTLIELMVVVAIIAVMAAVAVPNFISSQRRAEAQRHNEHARGFYFAVQNTLLSTMENDNTEKEFFLPIPEASAVVTRRRTSPIFSGGAAPVQPIVTLGRNFFVYVVMGADGRIESADLRIDTPDSTNIAEYPTASPPLSSGSADHTFNLLIEEMEGYMAADGKMGRYDNQGHYFAMFDSNFRVTMAYFSLHANRNDVETATYVYTTDNRIAGLTFGAHPLQYSFWGAFNVRGLPRNNAGNWFVPIVDDSGIPI